MTQFSLSLPTPAERALGVIARTSDVWRIAPSSPRALSRRAPFGYVPIRLLRRRLGAVAPTLAYAW